MRGSGKTSNARALANFLNMPLIDLDDAFQLEFSTTIKEFVDKNGWPEFRKKEELVFKKVLLENANRVIVISTGGGLIESPTARETLRNCFSSYIVVQLHRDIGDIVEYLSLDKTRVRRIFQENSEKNRRI